MKQFQFLIAFVFIGLISTVSSQTVFAEDPTPAEAEKKLILLLDAIKNKDHKKFIEPGNKAFKEMNGEWQFDTHIRSHHYKIIKGYQLKFLGSIKRLGTREFLWKVSFTGEKYEKRASVSISKYGEVVGFDLF